MNIFAGIIWSSSGIRPAYQNRDIPIFSCLPLIKGRFSYAARWDLVAKFGMNSLEKEIIILLLSMQAGGSIEIENNL